MFGIDSEKKTFGPFFPENSLYVTDSNVTRYTVDLGGSHRWA